MLKFKKSIIFKKIFIQNCIWKILIFDYYSINLDSFLIYNFQILKDSIKKIIKKELSQGIYVLKFWQNTEIILKFFKKFLIYATFQNVNLDKYY